MTASGHEMVRSGPSRLHKVGLRLAAFTACFLKLSAAGARRLRAALYAPGGFEGLTAENVKVLTGYSNLEEMASACEASGWTFADAWVDIHVGGGGERRRVRESELPLLPDVCSDGLLDPTRSFMAEAVGQGIIEIGRCLGTPPGKLRAWGLRKFAAENVVRSKNARLACRFLQHRSTEGQCLNRVYRNSLNNVAAGGFVTGAVDAGKSIVPVSVLVARRVPAIACLRGLSDLPADAPERAQIEETLAPLLLAKATVEAQLEAHYLRTLLPAEVAAGRRVSTTKFAIRKRKRDGEAKIAASTIVRVAEGLRLHMSARSVSGYRGVHFHKPSGLYQAVVERGSRPTKRTSLGYFKAALDAAVAYARFCGEESQAPPVPTRMHFTLQRKAAMAPEGLALLGRLEELRAVVHRVRDNANNAALAAYVRRLHAEGVLELQQNAALRRVRVRSHTWGGGISEAHSAAFGLERSDFTREAQLLRKVPKVLGDAVLRAGLMALLRGLPQDASESVVYARVQQSGALVMRCEACVGACGVDGEEEPPPLPAEVGELRASACRACGGWLAIVAAHADANGVAHAACGISREAYQVWLHTGSGSWRVSGVQAAAEAKAVAAEPAQFYVATIEAAAPAAAAAVEEPPALDVEATPTVAELAAAAAEASRVAAKAQQALMLALQQVWYLEPLWLPCEPILTVCRVPTPERIVRPLGRSRRVGRHGDRQPQAGIRLQKRVSKTLAISGGASGFVGGLQ